MLKAFLITCVIGVLWSVCMVYVSPVHAEPEVKVMAIEIPHHYFSYPEGNVCFEHITHWKRFNPGIAIYFGPADSMVLLNADDAAQFEAAWFKYVNK